MATCDATGVLKLWDLANTGASVGRMQPSRSGCTALLYSAQEQVVLEANKECVIHMWDLRKKAQPLWSITGHDDWITEMQLVRCAMEVFELPNLRGLVTLTADHELMFLADFQWCATQSPCSLAALHRCIVGWEHFVYVVMPPST